MIKSKREIDNAQRYKKPEYWPTYNSSVLSSSVNSTNEQITNQIPTDGLYDNFQLSLYNLTADGNISSNGKWLVDYLQGGHANILVESTGNRYLELAPDLAGAARAAKFDTTKSWITLHGRVRARLDEQSAFDTQSWYSMMPLIGYVNETSYFYFKLNIDGWELGKVDNDIADESQEIIATGNVPSALIGYWNTIEWWIVDDVGGSMRIRVDVNGATVIDIIDSEAWQRDGTTGTGTSAFLKAASKKISLTSQASTVSWDDVFADYVIAIGNAFAPATQEAPRTERGDIHEGFDIPINLVISITLNRSPATVPPQPGQWRFYDYVELGGFIGSFGFIEVIQSMYDGVTYEQTGTVYPPQVPAAVGFVGTTDRPAQFNLWKERNYKVYNHGRGVNLEVYEPVVSSTGKISYRWIRRFFGLSTGATEQIDYVTVDYDSIVSINYEYNCVDCRA